MGIQQVGSRVWFLKGSNIQETGVVRPPMERGGSCQRELPTGSRDTAAILIAAGAG